MLSRELHPESHIFINSYCSPVSIVHDQVEQNFNIDNQDLEPEALNSNIAKWKRNVRNVLQHREKTGEIDWDGEGVQA